MKSILSLAVIAALLYAQTIYADDDGDKGKGKKRGAFGDPEAAFKKLDANNDGKVSKEEFAKFRDNLPEKVKEKAKEKGGDGKLGEKLFDLADTNKDGFLSLDEFKKMREKMAEKLKNKGKGNGTK